MTRATRVAAALAQSTVVGAMSAVVAYMVLPICQGQYACSYVAVHRAFFVGLFVFAVVAALSIVVALDNGKVESDGSNNNEPPA